MAAMTAVSAMLPTGYGKPRKTLACMYRHELVRVHRMAFACASAALAMDDVDSYMDWTEIEKVCLNRIQDDMDFGCVRKAR